VYSKLTGNKPLDEAFYIEPLCLDRPKEIYNGNEIGEFKCDTPVRISYLK